MTITIEQATRMGASAGLMAEGEPADIASWPADAKMAFHEQYARGRRTRSIAEGQTTLAASPDRSRFAGMSRAALAREFETNPKIRAEFGDVSAFVAYAIAEQSGKARIMRGKVVS